MGALVLGIAIVMLFSAFVPYNMDEFIHYDTILCYAFPGNNPGGICDPFKLNFLNTGLIVPLRAYFYSGSFPAFYYLPFWLLWRSPLSARFVGLLFLAGGAWILARRFAFRFSIVVVSLLLLFPYVYMSLADTGPVGLQMFSVYALYVLFDRWCRTLRTRWIASITFLVFFCIWTKFSYFWLLPGLAIILFLHVVRHRHFLLQRGLKRFFLQGMIAVATLTVMVGSLLLSTNPINPSDKPYWNSLRDSSTYSLSEVLQGTAFSTSSIPHILLHPLEASQRSFVVTQEEIFSRTYSLLLYVLIPLFTLLLLIIAEGKRGLREAVIPLTLYAAFLVTVLMIVRTKGSFAMHHAILSYPFLLLSITATFRAILDIRPRFERRVLRLYLGILFGLLLAANLFFFWTFPHQTIRTSDDVSKQALHIVLKDEEVARTYVTHVLDWGMFFYQGLYGQSSQSVFFSWGMKDAGAFRTAQEQAHREGRKVLFLFTPSETATDPKTLLSTLTLQRCNVVPPEAKWQLYAEPDPLLEQLCAVSQQSSLSVKLSLLQIPLRAALAF